MSSSRKITEKALKLMGPRAHSVLGIVTNPLGVGFTVVAVRDGDRYGRDGCLIHTHTVPLLEFYDRRGMRHVPTIGEFAARYLVNTLEMDLYRDGGMVMNASVPELTLSGANVREALAMLALDGDF